MTRAAAHKKLKVVRAVARLNIGGPAIHTCYLHQKLYPEFETILAVGRLDKGEGDMSYLLESDRGVVWVSSMSRQVRLLSDLATLVRLWRLLRRERPDIVHTHTAKAGALGRIAALLAGVPIVVHTYHGHIFRGGYFDAGFTRLFLTIERLLNRFTTQIVTVSESQARELAEEFRVAPRSRIAVISNGFDFSRFPDHAGRAALRREWNIADEQTLVVWAGRMVPVKNVELLAQVAGLARERKDVRFVIVGDGAERPKLEAALAGCENVRLVGWARDMAAVWSAADIALLTSRNEGTPSSLIEAMAAGKPFVTTPVGGVIDLFACPAQPLNGESLHCGNGLTFEAPAEAMQAINLLAANPELRRELGEKGRALVLQRYSADRLLGDMRRLYYDLAARSEWRAASLPTHAVSHAEGLREEP